jgi:hypothetical protein
MAAHRKPPPIALVTFGVTFLLTVLNSRFLALFVVLQVAIIANYCVAELRRVLLAGGAGLAGLVLVGYGLFRDFESYPGTANPFDVIGFMRFYAARSAEGPLTWFYSFNVEGFAGLAGILTREMRGGGVQHDFGASTASIFTQLIPHSIRTDPNLPFLTLSRFFESLYPYQGGSIVRPGLELAYAHFGIAGILALGILLGWLVVWLHRAMRAVEKDRLLIGVLSVQVLLLIRGTFVDAIFFGLGDLVILIAYRQMQTFNSERAWALSRLASRRIRIWRRRQ